jgi:hypothetical protein
MDSKELPNGAPPFIRLLETLTFAVIMTGQTSIDVFLVKFVFVSNCVSTLNIISWLCLQRTISHF